jgi:uncharacterized RDD family membrane protein YckC
MRHVEVYTAQHVAIGYTVASVGDRILAFIIDLFIMIVFTIGMLILFTIAGVITGLVNREFMFVIPFVMILPVMFYDLLMEYFFNGQSIGKKVRNIKVVRLDGTPATLGNYLLRWLFRLVDISLTQGGVAILTILINGKGQRLGDLAAGTTVIKLQIKMSLYDTVLTPLPVGYQGRYLQVKQLNDKETALVKEVLQVTFANPNTELKGKLQNRMKSALEKKLGVINNDDPRSFLETVLKDYTFFNK